MKFIQYVIAVIVIFAFIIWIVGGLKQQSEIDGVMSAVKEAATDAVDVVTEGAAEVMDAADVMASDATLETGMAAALEANNPKGRVRAGASREVSNSDSTAVENTDSSFEKDLGRLATNAQEEEPTKQVETFTQ